jgi:hypothetical protein
MPAREAASPPDFDPLALPGGGVGGAFFDTPNSSSDTMSPDAMASALILACAAASRSACAQASPGFFNWYCRF